MTSCLLPPAAPVPHHLQEILGSVGRPFYLVIPQEYLGSSWCFVIPRRFGSQVVKFYMRTHARGHYGGSSSTSVDATGSVPFQEGTPGSSPCLSAGRAHGGRMASPALSGTRLPSPRSQTSGLQIGCSKPLARGVSSGQPEPPTGTVARGSGNWDKQALCTRRVVSPRSRRISLPGHDAAFPGCHANGITCRVACAGWLLACLRFITLFPPCSRAGAPQGTRRC